MEEKDTQNYGKLKDAFDVLLDMYATYKADLNVLSPEYKKTVDTWNKIAGLDKK